MKTLDEVITANDCCDHGEPDSRCEDCPYNGIGACCAERETDALQWLKGYRAHIELDKLRDKCETLNDPLSWDELQKMEGKPVWVEYESCKRKEWTIIDCFYIDAFGKVKMNVALPHDYWNLEKEMMDKAWQAYRNERDER